MRNNKAYLNCLTRQQAQELWWQKLSIYGFFKNLPVEAVHVVEALGRVTASSVFAKQSVPHYNGAAMDGIAVLAQDTFGAQDTEPKKLNLLPPDAPFITGGCYIVDTGDTIPPGTTAVIMIEDVHFINETAEIIAPAVPWQHVRIIGEDIVVNEMVIPEYHVITPVDIAALLAAGVEGVEVLKRPRVAIIPTGDEIVATSMELKPGAILEVNSHMLAAAVAEWGGEPVKHGIIKDDRQIIKQIIFDSLQLNDIVIVNAGTSAGRGDYTAEVLSELGEVLVHGVAIKPGKPVILAICQGKPVIGLPGYPVAAMLTAELFIRKVLLARQRLPLQEPNYINAVLAKQVASTVGVEEYIRVSVGNVKGRVVAAPLNRGAGLISSLTKAQGIISIMQADSGINNSMAVPVRLLNKARPSSTILAVGSHDLALELLGVFLRRQAANNYLSCANVGSLGGIMAIRNNEAHIAGIHLLNEKMGCYNISYVEKYLSNNNWCMVHLAMRQQGLLVKAGNPKAITGLGDLLRTDITFVNRQRGSGTRALLDHEIGKQGINYKQIIGYDKEVGTHMSVAAAVAAGAADAGLAVRAAGQAVGLDFIAVAQEQYDLLLNFDEADERMGLIIKILQTADFKQDVEAMGGYDLRNSGKIIKSRGL